MKLSLGLATALAGLAAAATHPAEVYLLHSSSQHANSQSETPSLPRQLARLVFLQRLSPSGRIGSLKDIPEKSISADEAVSYLNAFGKPIAPLMAEERTAEPKQLLVMVEGMSADKAAALKEAVPGWKPSFKVDDVPSAKANAELASVELASFDMTNRGCDVDAMLNPADDSCVQKDSRVVRFDVQKDSTILEILASRLPQLLSLASSGELETTLVLLPESSRKSSISSWGGKPSELRARQAVEEVMTEVEDVAAPAATSPASTNAMPFVPAAAKGSIPACFQVQNSCVEATNNCNGHGKCEDVYLRSDGSSPNGKTCFQCRCQGTKGESGGYTHWAGPTCSKVDVSVPLWLFVGFTLLMVGILSFALSLLFNVGEEPLPGVIGAGVSKSK